MIINDYNYYSENSEPFTTKQVTMTSKLKPKSNREVKKEDSIIIEARMKMQQMLKFYTQITPLKVFSKDQFLEYYS